MAKRYFPTVEETGPVIVDELIPDTSEDEMIPDTSADEIEPVVYGYVTDCLKLNIRTEPKVGANVLCVVEIADELLIDMNKSTEDWYSVTTNVGAEGFCMKKYVTVE